MWNNRHTNSFNEKQQLTIYNSVFIDFGIMIFNKLLKWSENLRVLAYTVCNIMCAVHCWMLNCLPELMWIQQIDFICFSENSALNGVCSDFFCRFYLWNFCKNNYWIALFKCLFNIFLNNNNENSHNYCCIMCI